jgi:protein tyrosine/serine phosphatase
MTPFSETYWIHSNFLAGRYPNTAEGEVASLQRLGVNLLVDLTTPGELPPYRAQLSKGVQYRQTPIRNFDVPQIDEMVRILDLLDEALKAGQKLYLHCWGGLGRTGTVVGCFLVRRGLTGEEALAELWRLRMSCGCDPDEPSPETQAQRAMVLGWKPEM